MNYDNCLSASDVALLSKNNNDGFDGNNGWWIILLLLCFGGFGNGFLGGGGNIQQGYTLASDFATLERQLDSGLNSLERKGDYIQEQLCNSDQMMLQGFSNVNTNILSSTAGLNNVLATNFANLNQGISNNRYENQLAMNNLSSQFSNCCCETRVQGLDNTNAIQSNLANINYNNASNTNSIINAINSGFCNSNQLATLNTRDIIDNNNANFRQLHDEIIANRIEEKNAKILEQQNEINALRLTASQERQNSYLINELKPCPQPAYIVQNPYCNCNNSCGCM